MNSGYQLSSRDYERAADASRQRLASALNELSDSLTPGRVLDEVMSYARSGGGDFLRGLGNAATANPVPSLLIGVGAAMFLSGRGRIDRDRRTSVVPGRRSSSRMGETVGEAADSVARGVKNGAASAVEDAASQAADLASRATSAAAEQIGSAGEAVRSTVTAGTEKAREAVAAGMDAAGEAVGEASSWIAGSAESVADQGRHLRDETAKLTHDLVDRAARLAREQPLIAAAAGLAIGAAIAALLPRTETEDAFMGETSDAVKEAAGEAVQEQYDRAKSTAESVVEKVKETAEEEGLTPTAAADAVRDLGDRVKTVATAAEDAVRKDRG